MNKRKQGGKATPGKGKKKFQKGKNGGKSDDKKKPVGKDDLDKDMDKCLYFFDFLFVITIYFRLLSLKFQIGLKLVKVRIQTSCNLIIN